MDVHRSETPGIVVTALTRNLHSVARHVLALLLQNAGDVRRGTRTKCDQQQFYGRSRRRSFAVGIQGQCMTGGSNTEEQIITDETHSRFHGKRIPQITQTKIRINLCNLWLLSSDDLMPGRARQTVDITHELGDAIGGEGLGDDPIDACFFLFM